jgi:hypothetical protein
VAIEVFTPLDHSGASVDLANRRFRKQILPLGTIDYHGRKISFDRPYLENLVKSFTGKAFDQVPFQLADHENRHTNDPERTRGWVTGLSVTDKGLEADIELTERGAQVVKDNPNLGVSVRVFEQFEREGQKFGRAMQHVLGTVDPHVQRMSPWQAVAMSSAVEVTETVDLSDASYERESEMESAQAADETVAVELSKELLAQLQELLGEYDDGPFEDDDDEQPETDEVEDDEEDDEDEEWGELTAESEDDDQIDWDAALKAIEEDAPSAELVGLAHQDDVDGQILELRRELNAERAARISASVDGELAQIGATGLAPSIIEACRPLLEAPTPIELSNSETLDVAQQARTVLMTLLELSRKGEAFVELDSEEGRYLGSDSVQSRRDEQLSNWPEN